MRKLICLALFVSLGFFNGCGGEKEESKNDSNRQVAEASNSNKTTSRDSQTKKESRAKKPVDDIDSKTEDKTEDKTETASTNDDEEANENRDSRRGNSTADRKEANRDERSREKTAPRDNARDTVVDADGDMDEEMEDDVAEPVHFVAAFPSPDRVAGLKPDNLIPEIEGKDLEGVEFRLSDYQGKVIMLDFWGDWWPPCRAMFPHERSLVEDMQGRPFVLLGVNNDKEIERVKKSVRKNKINWRSFIDGAGGPIVRQFGIRGFPTIMLIDHNGVIVHSNIRGKAMDKEIIRLVKEAEADGMEGVKVAAEMRVFRDSTGEHRIEAIAESMDGDKVVLRKKEGGIIKMSPEKLSKADQAYLKTVDLETADDGEAESEETIAENEQAMETGGDEESAWHTFSNKTGKFSVEARIVKVESGTVTLEKRDGSTVDVPVSKLSQDDQDFVNDQE